MKGSSLKKEYNLKKLKKRPGPIKIDPNAVKIPISIRLDSIVLVSLKEDAIRLGIPYQTFVGSILHRYVTGELVDKNSPDLTKLLKSVS